MKDKKIEEFIPGGMKEETMGEFVSREVRLQPSTERTRKQKEMFMDSPYAADGEWLIGFCEGWKEHLGDSPDIRKGHAQKRAMESVTPFVIPGDLLPLNLTRFVRGGIPSTTIYGSTLVHDLLETATEEEAHKWQVMEGGGAAAKESSDYVKLGGIWLCERSQFEPLSEAMRYFADTCQSQEDGGYKLIAEARPDLLAKWDLYQKVYVVSSKARGAGASRYVPDFETMFKKGFKGIKERIKEKIAQQLIHSLDDIKKLQFWNACLLTIEGYQTYVRNYETELRRLASVEKDPAQRAEYEYLADILAWVPENPARTFHEALMVVWFTILAGWFTTLGNGSSYGHINSLLEPYYLEDLEKGKITREKALELFENYRFKASSIMAVSKRGAVATTMLNIFNNWTIGGEDEHGRSAETVLDEIVLEAGRRWVAPSPTLSIMVSPQTSDQLMMEAVETVKSGSGYPAFFNYRVMVDHLLTYVKDMTLEDARLASIFGCTEVGCQGRSDGIIGSLFVNATKVLEVALFDGVDPRTGIKAFEFHDGGINNIQDLVRRCIEFKDDAVRIGLEGSNYYLGWSAVNDQQHIAAIFTRDCIERGKGWQAGGSRYTGSSAVMNYTGEQNLADSLASVEYNVFDKKNFTLEELKDALLNNFGYEDAKTTKKYSMLEQIKITDKYSRIHKLCLDAPKFGNDDDYADRFHVATFTDYANKVIGKFKNWFGAEWVASAVGIAQHGPFGQISGATPDGRLSGITLCDGSMSPVQGRDHTGPIAVINSASKFDHTLLRATLLNMKMHPSAISGDQGIKKMVQLIRQYMNQGGFHIQFNVVDSKMLIDAQKNPDQYRDLTVRVAGFTAFWNELSKPIQDEIIYRSQYDEA